MGRRARGAGCRREARDAGRAAQSAGRGARPGHGGRSAGRGARGAGRGAQGTGRGARRGTRGVGWCGARSAARGCGVPGAWCAVRGVGCDARSAKCKMRRALRRGDPGPRPTAAAREQVAILEGRKATSRAPALCNARCRCRSRAKATSRLRSNILVTRASRGRTPNARPQGVGPGARDARRSERGGARPTN